MDFFLSQEYVNMHRVECVCVCVYIASVCVCGREDYCNISLLNYRSVVVELCSLHVPHAS